jgi:hypothetical protein
MICEGKMMDRAHSVNLGVDGRIKEVKLEGTEWIHLAKDTDRWRDPVNSIMNLRIR